MFSKLQFQRVKLDQAEMIAFGENGIPKNEIFQ